MTAMGLYYPFIHFQDDAWVKLAALYWDRIGRIVPAGFETHDSETVRRLSHESQFIENYDPRIAARRVGLQFLELIHRNESELRQHYGVSAANTRDRQSQRGPQSTSSMFSRLKGALGFSIADQLESEFPNLTRAIEPSYIYLEKLSPKLVDALQDSGLAAPALRDGGPILYLHPALATVYMTALAEELALIRGLHPVADGGLWHLAVNGWSLARLAQALLGDVTLVPAEAHKREIQAHLALLGIRAVMPSNVSDVSVDRIVRFRERHRQERIAFLDMLDSLAEEIAIFNLTDQDALAHQLDVAYEERMRPQVDALRDALAETGFDPVLSVFGVATTVGGGPLLEHVVPDRVLSTGIAVVTGVSAIAFAHRKVRKDLRNASPAASYLLSVEQELLPGTLVQRLAHDAKSFIL